MSYNRIYRLIITPVKFGTDIPTDKSIIITSPLTIKFNVQRMPFGGQTTATIDVYNLSEDLRRQLFLDWFDFKNIRRVILEAGYQDGRFDTIYKGRIRCCFPRKERTDVITHIEADSSLGVLDSNLTTSLAEGERLIDVAHRVIDNIETLDEGELSLPDFKFQRPVALMGNSLSVLKTYTKDNVAIDLDKIIVIDDDEVIDGDIRVISDETGLLGVPERQRTSITVNCMFEPRIKVGQGLEIKSRVAPQFDGQYKVWGVSHTGTIGGTQGGECTTRIILWTGLNLFGRYKTSWETVKKKYGGSINVQQ